MKNPALAIMLWRNFNGEHDCMNFVAELGEDLDKQAKEYMKYEGIEVDGLIHAYWHNAIEDSNGNRYEPVIKEI